MVVFVDGLCVISVPRPATLPPTSLWRVARLHYRTPPTARFLR